MEIRWYKEGDEGKIVSLFDIVFQREMDQELWFWRFRDGPFGKGIILLMFEGERLLGQYSVIPLPLSVGNTIVNAVLSMTTMTHPDFRGRGIFPILAQNVFDFCKKEGYKAVFGFPNRNSYGGFKKLGWQGFGNITGWEIEDSRGFIDKVEKGIESKRSLTCEDVMVFGPEVDDLWDVIKEHFQVVVPRTSAFLNWRYLQKPGKEYIVQSFRTADGTLKGFVVLKIYDGLGQLPIGHIVDMVSIFDDAIEKEMVARCLDFFASREIYKISAWFPAKGSQANVIQRLGFRAKKWPTYFGLKLLSKGPYLNNVLDISNWRITMGDSDVF